MFKVDEFDRTGEPASADEIAELLPFADERYPELAAEVRSSIAAGSDYQYLYRTLVDDMRRMKAGRFPRYTAFRILPTDN